MFQLSPEGSARGEPAFLVSLIVSSSSSSSALSDARRSSAQRSSLSISVSNHVPFFVEMASRSPALAGQPCLRRVLLRVGRQRRIRLHFTGEVEEAAALSLVNDFTVIGHSSKNEVILCLERREGQHACT